MSSFEECLEFVLRWEGGYVDDPDDKGGKTNRGVVQAVYDEWRERHHYDQQSVKDITDGEVKQIYHEQYWRPARCPAMDFPMSLVMFDSAVNHGVNRAVKILQGAVDVTQDGVFGPRTMQAYDDQEQCHGTAYIARLFLDRRELFYRAIVQSNPRQEKFLRGWMNRLSDLRKEAKV